MDLKARIGTATHAVDQVQSSLQQAMDLIMHIDDLCFNSSTADVEIIMLMQSLMAFAYGKDVGSAVGLVRGLKVTEDQWRLIMGSGFIYLDDGDIDAIDEHFEIQAKSS